MQVSGLQTDNTGTRSPAVSIVCVTLNAARQLPNLINSIACKKSNDVEFIVIDGSSTDGTIDILNKNKRVIDFWLSEPDAGIYDAMNKALNYVNGQWIIFLGADDELCEGFAEAVTLLKNANTIYYGNVNYYGKIFTKIYDDYYLTKLNICHQSIFYPKVVFAKYKFDLRYNVYADYDLNLRCWKDQAFKFEHVDHLVASFPEGGYSSFTKDAAFEMDRDKLFKKYLKVASYLRYLNRTLGFWNALKRVVLINNRT
jgi:glycosyltransferase involved in cell wall biosynthesis